MKTVIIKFYSGRTAIYMNAKKVKVAAYLVYIDDKTINQDEIEALTIINKGKEDEDE